MFLHIRNLYEHILHLFRQNSNFVPSKYMSVTTKSDFARSYSNFDHTFWYFNKIYKKGFHKETYVFFQSMQDFVNKSKLEATRIFNTFPPDKCLLTWVPNLSLALPQPVLQHGLLVFASILLRILLNIKTWTSPISLWLTWRFFLFLLLHPRDRVFEDVGILASVIMTDARCDVISHWRTVAPCVSSVLPPMVHWSHLCLFS